MLPVIVPDTPRSMPLFSGLSKQDKDKLMKGGRIRQLSRRQMLFAHGDSVTHFYLIVSGTVQLFRSTSGGYERTINILTTGQTLCEGEIMNSCHIQRVNCAAVEDVMLLEFSASWLKESTKNYNIFALNLLSLIAKRAYLAELEAEHLATMTAVQLVACFLQRLCVLYNFNHEGFDLPYSKTLIASRLGMELETFSRTLAKLKEHGIVVEGSRVTIADHARIGQYICDICSNLQ